MLGTGSVPGTKLSPKIFLVSSRNSKGDKSAGNVLEIYTSICVSAISHQLPKDLSLFGRKEGRETTTPQPNVPPQSIVQRENSH